MSTAIAPAAADLEQHRTALMGHCYRMLGSLTEAEDAVQDAIIRAWRALDRFDGRSSLRTWLYRIATNVCIDRLAASGRIRPRRRTRPVDETPAESRPSTAELVQYPGTHWLEPIPDDLAVPSDASPVETAALRQSVRLAFVAALQHLPPKQRAALLLVEVIGWSPAEVAASLDTSVASINSALQRARATLAARNLQPGTPVDLGKSDEQLLSNYITAFEQYDVDRLTSLLHADAAFSMPPYALWLQGHSMVREWLLGRGSGCRGSRIVPARSTSGGGCPTFGQYRKASDGAAGHVPWALVVLETDQHGIQSWTSFLDTATLFRRFGLPDRLD